MKTAGVARMVQEENSGSAPTDSVDSTETGELVETAKRDPALGLPELPDSLLQLQPPFRFLERRLVRDELINRIQELEALEEQKRQKLVREALGKFGFFMHLTAFFAGCSYLVLLGIIVPKAMPWVFIPIGLWCIGFAYHGWRAWHPKPPGEKAFKKALKELEEQQNLNGGEP